MHPLSPPRRKFPKPRPNIPDHVLLVPIVAAQHRLRNTQSLKEIWRGPKLTEARRKHLAKRGADVTVCAKCDYWHEPGLGVKLWT